MPASVLILMEAASAAVTVCFTDCIKFCAFPTSISVASMSSSVPGIKKWTILQIRDVSPCAPSMVAFTVERIFSWVPMVGMRSHTWSRFWGIRCKQWEFQSVAHRPHPLVRALLGQLLGQPRHLVRRLCDGFSNGDQLSLAAAVLLSRE